MSGRGHLTIYCETLEEKQEWMRDLSQAVFKLRNKHNPVCLPLSFQLIILLDTDNLFKPLN